MFKISTKASVRLPIEQHEAIFDPDSHRQWLPDIGESSRNALRQFLGNENKLSQNPYAQIQYQEMIETGHSETVPESDHNLPPVKHFLMPHHAGWKSSSTTTKCRSVFNASAKTTNGKSLIASWLVQNNSATFLRY